MWCEFNKVYVILIVIVILDSGDGKDFLGDWNWNLLNNQSCSDTPENLSAISSAFVLERFLMTLKPQKMRQGQDKPLSEPQKPPTLKTSQASLAYPGLS